jgi:hypothetical protein
MALLELTRRQVIALTGLIGAATIGNAVVWPTLDFLLTDEPGWIFASAAALVLGAAVTARLSLATMSGATAPSRARLATE